jgi:hypothetical protein
LRFCSDIVAERAEGLAMEPVMSSSRPPHIAAPVVGTAMEQPESAPIIAAAAAICAPDTD